jgi:hypothetical protein
MGERQVTELKSATTDPVVEVSLGLLVEYTDKLRKLRDVYMNIRDISAFNALNGILTENLTAKHIKETYMYSCHDYHSLAEQVSQKIEHTNLHPLDELNLKLKLRDFEEQVRFFDRVVVPMISPTSISQNPSSW